MSSDGVTDSVEFLLGTLDGTRRSVVHNQRSDNDLVYTRDDVEDQYTNEGSSDAVVDLGIEALGKRVEERHDVPW